jgi:long-chain acyl-CoA synthetase
VQLQSALEQRLGLELTDDAIATVPTIGALRSLLNQPLGQSQSNGQPQSNDRQSAPPTSPSPTAPITQPAATQSAEPAPTYAHWPWSWPFQALRVAFIELILRPLVWILAAPKVIRTSAADQFPAGPILIIANHVTAYDGALVLYALPRCLRHHVAIAMSGEILEDLKRARNQPNAFLNLLAPAAYWLVTALFNVFPLPRLRGFRASFAHAGEAMDRDYSVLIFPEGTRSTTGQLQRFRPGIGLLANDSAAPILPIALIGLGELPGRKPSGLHFGFRSRKLEIRLGAPIPTAAATERTAPEQRTAQLEATLQHLLAD